MSRLLLSGVIAAAIAISPASPQAQARPYTIEQLKILIQGGLPATSILRRVTQNCLAFKLDETATRELRTAGATAPLLAGLRTACLRLPEPAQVAAPVRTDTVRTPARDTARVPAQADPARLQPRTDTAHVAARATRHALRQETRRVRWCARTRPGVRCHRLHKPPPGRHPPRPTAPAVRS
jgi:hypothetical protein